MSQYYTHLHPIKKKTILTPDYTHFIDLSRSVAEHRVIDICVAELRRRGVEWPPAPVPFQRMETPMDLMMHRCLLRAGMPHKVVEAMVAGGKTENVRSLN